MKNIIKIILPMLVVVLAIIGCDKAGGIDDEVFSAHAEGASVNWVSAPEGKNKSKKLKLSNPTTGLDYEVELRDKNDGSTVQAVKFTVTQQKKALTSKEKDAVIAVGSSVTFLEQTNFTQNDNGNQGFSGTITPNSLATVLNVSTSTFSEKNTLFLFEVEVKRNDVYSFGHGTGLNAVRPFVISFSKETTSLTKKSVHSKYVNRSVKDTIFLEFANESTQQLMVRPTIAVSGSTGSRTDYEIGSVQTLPFTSGKELKGMDSVYYALITPTAADLDTVDIVISGASAVASGFVMVNDTIKKAYITDNVAPMVLQNNSSTIVNAEGTIIGYEFDIIFSEDITGVTLKADFSGKDDDSTKKISTKGSNNLDYVFDWKAAKGMVALSVEVKDIAGNLFSVPVVNLAP